MKTASNRHLAGLRSSTLSLGLGGLLLGLVRLGCGDAAPPVPPPETPPPAPNVVAEAPPPASAPTVSPASQPAPAPTPAVDPPPPPPVSRPSGPVEVQVLVSSEQAGELEPCGCAEGQYGGLPRRASLLKAWGVRGRHVILADNGDIVLDASLQSQQKLETTLQVHQVMGTAALNIGETELLLDPQLLQLTAMNFAAPYVSANVQPCDRTSVVVPVELAGGVVRVGITGFLDPELVTEAEPGWQVRAPAAALRPVLEELARTADVTIVLAHATAARANAILDGLPEPDAVVVAHEAEDPLEPIPTVLRGVPAPAPGTQAKYLARFALRMDGDRLQVVPRYEGLNEKIPDDPRVRALLDGYQAILHQLNIPDLTPRRPYEAGGTYVGGQRCAECHVSAAAVWAESKHAHAMEIIVERNHEFDPDCLKCHTTGFAYVGGYTSREETPRMSFVSCEACHGPGSNHAAKPGPGYGQVGAPEFCMTCHDAPNSPNFNFETYWPKIAHELDWERPAAP